jgi:hypothetical protein
MAIRKLLLVLLTALLTVSGMAMAGSRISCEGTMEHGSGGGYISSENKPTCWFGVTEYAALSVCKIGDHCKATGISKRCAKDPDLRHCREVIKLYSISRGEK